MEMVGGKPAGNDRFLENVLYLRSQRQAVLAANIANADTPNYKARDFNFKDALQQATGALAPLKLGANSTGHLPGVTTKSTADLLFRTPSQPSLDGNTVEMNAERAEFALNATMYEFAAQRAFGEYKEMNELMKSMSL